jgi:hypothetical protein
VASATFLVLVVCLGLVLGACGVLFGEQVQQLRAGDCFRLGSLPDEVGRVSKTACFGNNTAHVLGWVDFSDENTYPETRWFNGVLANKCNRLLDGAGIGVVTTVSRIGWLVPTEESWEGGERRALCYYQE